MEKKSYTPCAIAKELDSNLQEALTLIAYFARVELSDDDLEEWRKYLPGEVEEVCARFGIPSMRAKSELDQGILRGYKIDPALGGGRGLFTSDIYQLIWSWKEAPDSTDEIKLQDPHDENGLVLLRERYKERKKEKGLADLARFIEAIDLAVKESGPHRRRGDKK